MNDKIVVGAKGATQEMLNGFKAHCERKESPSVKSGKEVPTARLGKDGQSVLCGAVFDVTPQGIKRFRCGGKLGAVVWDSGDLQHELLTEGDVWRLENAKKPLFEIAVGFGFDCQDESQRWPPTGIFRQTTKPFVRTDRHLRILTTSEPFDANSPPPPNRRKHFPDSTEQFRRYEWDQNERQVLFYGEEQAAEFVLPIKVLCPRCSGLNSITDVILKSAVAPK